MNCRSNVRGHVSSPSQNLRAPLVGIVTLIAASIAGSAVSSAATVCFGGGAGSSSCTAGAESQIFIQDASNTLTVYGNVGSSSGLPLVDFVASGIVNGSNANGAITQTIGGPAVPSLAISVPGYTFTDLVFNLTASGPGGEIPQDLTITAVDGNGVAVSAVYDSLMKFTPYAFDVVATSGVLTKIDLSASGYITQADSFNISGLSPIAPAVPEPSTWAMMLIGLAGLGFAGYRKGRKARATVAGGV